MYRQGDVLVLGIDELPADARPSQDQESARVLVQNPRTGHAHVLTGGAIYQTSRRTGSRTIIELAQPTALVHNEHDAIEIPPGIYEMVRQRTYEPLASGQNPGGTLDEARFRNERRSPGWVSRDVED